MNCAARVFAPIDGARRRAADWVKAIRSLEDTAVRERVIIDGLSDYCAATPGVTLHSELRWVVRGLLKPALDEKMPPHSPKLGRVRRHSLINSCAPGSVYGMQERLAAMMYSGGSLRFLAPTQNALAEPGTLRAHPENTARHSGNTMRAWRGRCRRK